MALTISSPTPWGVQVESAYCRAEDIRHTAKDSISFQLRRYVSRATAASFFAEASYVVPYDMNGGNPFKQAYEQLKALADFTGAVDVLEAGQAP